MLTVVCSYFPLPVDRGDPVRVLMVLRALARPYRLLVVRRPDTTDALVTRLGEQLPGVEIRAYPASPYRLGRLGPAGRFPEALAGGRPPWVRSRYSRPLHERLRRMGGDGLALGEAAGAYLPGTALRWHWDKANVLAASTRLDVAEAPTVAQTVRARYLTAVSRRYERRALGACATVSVTSELESARLVEAYGRPADLILPSAVELPEEYTPAPRERELVWLGSFGYRSNLLGLYRFLDSGWPALRAAAWRLSLVGSGLTPAVEARLRSYGGVRILGYVEDLRPVLAGARAGVVPLWTGAGVKLKTLTLLAHGVPVFSTPAGAEGIPPSAAIRVSDDPGAALGPATPDELDRMAAAARPLVEQEFSAERFGQRLTGFLARSGRDATDPARR